ncbi:unnamed protein product, partial [Iphiclides podalirius]
MRGRGAGQVRLGGAGVRGARAGVRERCACPPGHAGAHCERCAWTHARLVRAPSAAPAFECVPCPCNGHAGCRAGESAAYTCTRSNLRSFILGESAARLCTRATPEVLTTAQLETSPVEKY